MLLHVCMYKNLPTNDGLQFPPEFSLTFYLRWQKHWNSHFAFICLQSVLSFQLLHFKGQSCPGSSQLSRVFMFYINILSQDIAVDILLPLQSRLRTGTFTHILEAKSSCWDGHRVFWVFLSLYCVFIQVTDPVGRRTLLWSELTEWNQCR